MIEDHLEIGYIGSNTENTVRDDKLQIIDWTDIKNLFLLFIIKNND